MPRRDYRTGSITPKGADRWQIRWYDPPDPLDGSRTRRAETFHGTKRDAALRLRDLTHMAGVDTSAITLGAMIDRWLTDTRHELATVDGYRRGQRTIPAVTLALPLAKVKAETVRTLVRAAHNRYGVHRARLVHATVSGALSHAWRNEWIAANPARKVTPPPAPKRAGTQPSTEELMRLLAVVTADAQVTAWLLLSAMTGGRRGEVLALRWCDVDLERRQISIGSALDPVDAHRKDTKTHGQRTSPIGAITVVALRRWHGHAVERNGGPLAGDAYVFSDAVDGSRPWRPDLATKRFAKIRKKAGVTGVRLYDLRHYFASELLGDGADRRAVMELMGHARESTLEQYTHVLPGRHRELSDRIEEGLGA